MVDFPTNLQNKVIKSKKKTANEDFSREEQSRTRQAE